SVGDLDAPGAIVAAKLGENAESQQQMCDLPRQSFVRRVEFELVRLAIVGKENPQESSHLATWKSKDGSRHLHRTTRSGTSRIHADANGVLLNYRSRCAARDRSHFGSRSNPQCQRFYLALPHRLIAEYRQLPRHRDGVANGELRQRLPSARCEER